jgi:hypothetical protein
LNLPHNLYSGHRKQSFICADVDELVELRASQRTYNGAYMRTALGILGYSLTILRLFDRMFYRSMSVFLYISPHSFFLTLITIVLSLFLFYLFFIDDQ